MNAAVRLHGGLELRIEDGPASTGRAGDHAWPTRRLQRGLILADGEHGLDEEGVGFGVPVLKRGLETVFPGGMELTATTNGPVWEARAAYRMDLVERLHGRGGAVRPRLVYRAKDSLAALHRRVPALRRPLTSTSSALRRRLGWTTTYEQTAVVAIVPVTYTVRRDESIVTVDVDLTGVTSGLVTEIVLMNELGAGYFDRYADSSGAMLAGAAVGTWDDVRAATASFASSRRDVAFTLQRVPGARLHRGREVVAGRLAWAGFGYSLPPGPPSFAYTVHFSRGEART
jgi:hypothetical protein